MRGIRDGPESESGIGKKLNSWHDGTRRLVISYLSITYYLLTASKLMATPVACGILEPGSYRSRFVIQHSAEDTKLQLDQQQPLGEYLGRWSHPKIRMHMQDADPPF